MPLAPGACAGSGVTLKVKLLAAIRVLIRTRLRCRGSMLALRYSKLAKTSRYVIRHRCLRISTRRRGGAYEGPTRPQRGARRWACGTGRARGPFEREPGRRRVLTAGRWSVDAPLRAWVLDCHRLRAPVGRHPRKRDHRHGPRPDERTARARGRSRPERDPACLLY